MINKLSPLEATLLIASALCVKGEKLVMNLIQLGMPSTDDNLNKINKNLKTKLIKILYLAK